LQRPTP